MEKSSFFASVGGDRKYKAEEWAAYFSSFIGTGVFPAPSTSLQVVATGGMSVIVKAGKAWINGYFYNNTDDLTVNIPTADGVLNRIDRIVVRWDLTARNITARVKSSTPSAAPTAPTLQRDADAFELCLADVEVTAGATSISQARITDQRLNNNVCGLVAGVVQQIDTAAFNAQLLAWFDDQQADMALWRDEQRQEFLTWFAELQVTLSGDVAAEFAGRIATLESKTSVLEAKIPSVVYEIGRYPITVAPGAWTPVAGQDKLFQATVANAGINADVDVDIYLDVASMGAPVSDIVVPGSGAATIYATKIPEASITGTMVLQGRRA